MQNEAVNCGADQNLPGEAGHGDREGSEPCPGGLLLKRRSCVKICIHMGGTGRVSYNAQVC